MIGIVTLSLEKTINLKRDMLKNKTEFIEKILVFILSLNIIDLPRIAIPFIKSFPNLIITNICVEKNTNIFEYPLSRNLYNYTTIIICSENRIYLTVPH